MKTTMYELLGMVKDGKAPKKIIVGDSETKYDYVEELKDYINTRNQERLFEDEIGKYLKYYLNDEVEIIEEEKKIPKKLEVFEIRYNLDYIDYKNIETLKKCLNQSFQAIYDTLDLLIKNQNKIIDYLNKEKL